MTDQQLALRSALEAALRAAADECATACPAECRTHHPSIFGGGMTATGDAESVDGDIDAVAHVAAIAVQGELDRLRAVHFHEAARLLESAGCDDDAVNLLDNVADGIAQQYNPNPGHQPHCVAVTQGCCSCEEPEPERPHCDCYSHENYGRRHDPDCLTMRANPA